MRTTDNDRTPERGMGNLRKEALEDTTVGVTADARAQISITMDIGRLIASLPDDLQKQIYAFMQALHRYRASDRSEVEQRILLSPRVMRRKINEFVSAIKIAGSEVLASEFEDAVKNLWLDIAGDDKCLFEQIFPQTLPQASDDSIGNE